MEPEEYYGGHERVITSLADLHLRQLQVDALADHGRLRFYWRGQSNARWGVHSLLHRTLARQQGVAIEMLREPEVVAKEIEVVSEAREWVRPGVGARLTTVDLLARLQHFGVPTRLVDFTSEPKVATYFAVTANPDEDARLIIAAARRSPSDYFLNSFSVPWEPKSPTLPVEWARQLYVLNDHADFLRIIRQRGAFLTGGTPSTQPYRRAADGRELKAADVRRAMSLPLALHSWSQAEAAQSGNAVRGRALSVASALTIRIPRDAKPNIRIDLETEGYSMRRLFPDPEGYKDRSSIVQALLS